MERAVIRMNLLPYYEIQRCLDERIKRDHGVPDNIVDLKIAAFKVELAELANETRFFKFWSNKPMSPREVILEEFVDGIHFLLSIGLERKWDRFVKSINVSEFDQEKFYVELFNDLWEAQFNSAGEWKRMFCYYLAIGHKLGFTEDEIGIAYVKKNEVNHQRQNSGVY
jgi:dimeric dUTPase (all-alpha-NTP-PPase superfamily)